ncbi:MAG: response regulator transcription factor [Anaerolineales bacterium]
MNEETRSIQRVLVVDDHIMFREGLISLLCSTPDFKVVDQAGTMHEGIEKALLYKPDIILMDFSLPDGTGLEATRVILEQLPTCKIVFLTVYETDENLLSAIRLGAKGYMLKNVSSSSLIASLRALEQGEIAMSRKMMSKALEYSRFAMASPSKDVMGKLSPREIDILFELQSDTTNAEIASHLFLSENTVKHHIHNILDKLGIDNRRQAGIIARQMGFKKSSNEK